MSFTRKLVDVGLLLAGVVLVLAAVLFITDTRAKVAAVVAGLFLVEIGVWRVARPILPDQRRFRALRGEVDDFIILVRRLNSAALGARAEDYEERRRLEDVRSAMHEAVERMVGYAGRTDPEIPRAERRPWP